MKKTYLTLILINIVIVCLSQNIDSLSTITNNSTLKLSYNSSLTYPGLRAGIEFPFRTAHITKQKKSARIKEFTRDRFISANLSWYHHPNFHDNVYLTAGWTMRRTKSRGFFTDFSPEIGISRTFLGGTSYKVDDIGNVSIEKVAGYYYMLVSIGGGVGYDFSITRSIPIMAFYKFNLIAMFPYNSTIYLRPAMEIGIIYKPKKFFPFKIKSSTINRASK